MARRLYARIYLHFLAVLLLVGPISAAVFATGWRGAFVRDLGARLAGHAAWELGNAFDDSAARLRVVRRLSDEMGIDVTVRDARGDLLVAVGPELPRLGGADLGLVREGPAVFRWGRGWFAAAPIVDPSSGALRGTLAVALLHRFRYPPVWRPLLAVGLVLLVVALGAAPLARRISRPIERLTAASRRLGQGDLSYRLPPVRARAGDELGELTRAWNDMAERIEGLVRGHKELLANVSHELRSPLTRLRMALELLPVEPAGEARVREMEEDLMELERLIDALLTSSRLEARGRPLVRSRIEVAGLLGQLCERAARDPHLGAQVPALVRGAGEGLTLEADRELLVRALWNLIENAAKYGAPPIELGAEAVGERVRFEVCDAGPGIAESERERVFEAFYRGDRARTPGARAGFGLGLTLARRIAEAHGGSIHVTGRADGTGCRVILELPQHPPHT